MLSKNGKKVFILAWLINLVENIILLLVFGVKIYWTTIVGAGIFAIILAILTDKFIFKKVR